MRLLILDDDVAIGRLVGYVASSAGFSPEITSDAVAFQKAYEIAVPDAVVLDLQLGQSDGVEQLRFLSKKRFPYAVVLVSGFDRRVLASAADLARNQGLQVAATLGKPIGLPELRSAFAKVLAQTATLSRARLEQALHQNEIFLEYQPIVESGSRLLHKFEALARWKHPELGRLDPGRFIPLAEESPILATALTERAITLAARDFKRLQAIGISVPVAVNLSPRCLLNVTFPDALEGLLQREGMPSDRLCLEITESAVFDNEIETLDIFTRLRLKGIHLAIDDFGTGHSSIKLLRQLPFSTLKIDISFVRDVVPSQDARAIVKSLADLSETLGLESIAEGVETEETAATLAALKVGFLQGYLIGRPMAVDQIAVWANLRKHPAGLAPEASAMAASPAGFST